MIFLSVAAQTQTPLPPIAKEEFAQRRTALAREIQDGVFFLEGAKEPTLDLRYFQDDDFYYLTGVETQNASFLLVAEKGKLLEETLFLPPKDPQWERWNGERLAPGEGAEKLLGIRKTAANAELPDSLKKAIAKAKQVFTPTESEGGHGKGKKNKDSKRVASAGSLRAALADSSATLVDARNALDSLQVRKSPAEIARMERAIRITEQGFQAAVPLLRPGAFEYELMGAIEGTYLKNGAETFAFPSIVGSGPNSCRLHYEANRRQMREGELVVIDIGAKFEHYCADVTRTLPISGKYSPRQAEIYQLVLDAQKKAIEAAKPGVKVSDVHQAAWNYLNEKKVSKQFWHSTSHYLGLKVHDTGSSYGEELEPGMIITVEPGLYFPDENLGVRIEDDILITENGCRLLSTGAPREIAEIEAWIQKFRQ